MMQFPLPFDDFIVDYDVWERHGKITSLAGSGLQTSHGTAPKTAPILARQGRAYSDAMECKHLLPPAQCSFCLGLDEVVTPRYEEHDYVETSANREVQEYPESEVLVGVVHPREIHGPQTAVRIRQALRERST
jgi:hypothetical protein